MYKAKYGEDPPSRVTISRLVLKLDQIAPVRTEKEVEGRAQVDLQPMFRLIQQNFTD